MDRKKLDRTLIFAFFALAFTFLLIVVEAKVRIGNKVPTTVAEIVSTTAKRPTKLDFDDYICPITVTGMTYATTTEDPTIGTTESQIRQEPVYIPEPETERYIEATEEEYTEPEPEPTESENRPEEHDAALYSPSYFRRMGVIYWGGWTWTWYSERVLPGYGLSIPGRYTDDMGYVRDGDGYICLASDSLGYGAVINTPFGGHGKVYDCGCGSYDIVDVYVGW